MSHKQSPPPPNPIKFFLQKCSLQTILEFLSRCRVSPSIAMHETTSGLRAKGRIVKEGNMRSHSLLMHSYISKFPRNYFLKNSAHSLWEKKWVAGFQGNFQPEECGWQNVDSHLFLSSSFACFSPIIFLQGQRKEQTTPFISRPAEKSREKNSFV